jgi:ribosome-binding factor A
MKEVRQKRAAEQIKVVLSELLLRSVKDPRLQNVTITQVVVDRELQFANIYVNALGDESRQKEVLSALDKATGFMRSEVARSIRLRTAPQLVFHWDPSLAHAEEVNAILDSLDIPAAGADDGEKQEISSEE